MAPRYQNGDLIELKNGGPWLAVEKIVIDEGVASVHCVWFHKRQVRRMIADAASLDKFMENEYKTACVYQSCKIPE